MSDMPTDNGHTENSDSAPPVQSDDGGQGAGTLVEHLDEPGRRRESLAMIERAVRHGWEIDPKWTATLPKVAARIAANPDAPNRDRLAALRVLKELQSQNLEAAIKLNDLERMDSGLPTSQMAAMIVPATMDADQWSAQVEQAQRDQRLAERSD